MNSRRLDVLVVAGEPCWPAVNGGRVRTGALALALAREFNVAVAAPPDASELDSEQNGSPLPVIELPPRERPRIRHSLGVRPRLGRALVGSAAAAALADVVVRKRPRVVLYAMSYLAAVCPVPDDTHVVVDFANVEVDRLRSLATFGPPKQRASAGLEATKALAWEPRVARRADLVVAVSRANASRLSDWGADVVFVPNTADPVHDAAPSNPRGPAIFIASFGYAPNAEAADALLREVWPRVRARVPNARLILAGRESDRRFGWARQLPGVTVTGELQTVLPLLADAAVVLAPVCRGGGTQLKVVQALAARRVVVATPYSAQSVASELAASCVVGDAWRDYADAVADLLANVERRHNLESVLREARVVTWDEAVVPLVERLRPLVRRDASVAPEAVEVGADR